ncbi:MAG: HD domain-containing protein [Anaerolineae bacterium]|jgi:hypothetical protein|nr:HD domain-containing protein [Anaerolineae bacterium]
MNAFLATTVAVRVGQVGYALAARWTRHDDYLTTVLAPGERGLFDRLPATERAHALRVADRLRRAGYDGRDEATRSLLRAALLHDIGKAGHGVRLPHRVAYVALRAIAPAWLAHSVANPCGWRRPFFALAHHAELGAEVLTSVGSDPLTISLVRYHDDALPPPLGRYDHLLAALRRADDEG